MNSLGGLSVFLVLIVSARIKVAVIVYKKLFIMKIGMLSKVL